MRQEKFWGGVKLLQVLCTSVNATNASPNTDTTESLAVTNLTSINLQGNSCWAFYSKKIKVTRHVQTYYNVSKIVCDRCGEVFCGTDTCSALFSNKEVDIGNYSDWEMIDGKHYCPDCYEVEVIDGVYNVKAK